MDAASNRGIQYIRELRGNTKFSPMKSTYKIYIIDEAHMLTGESFNALLKTLEEPPSHVIFILATTEKHKIPETILSRCQNFSFKKFTHQEIIDRLKNILLKENILFEESVLQPITHKAEGSMRDAISCLDQILAYSSSEKILLEEVLVVLGILPFELYCKILTFIREKNLQELLLVLENAHNEGYNLKDFVWNLLNLIKSAYLIKINNTTERGGILSKSQFEVLSQEVTLWEREALQQSFYNFYDIYSNPAIFHTSSGHEIKISIEMAIISLFQKLQQPSVAKLSQKIIQLKNAIQEGGSFQDESFKSAKKTIPSQVLSVSSSPDETKKETNTQAEKKTNTQAEMDIDFVIQKEFMGQQDTSKEISKLFNNQ